MWRKARYRRLPGGAREGAIYELGGPAVYSFRELLKNVCEWTGHRRLLLSIPCWIAKFPAFFIQFLPFAPVTVDQILLLERDNVVSAEAARRAAHAARLRRRGAPRR